MRIPTFTHIYNDNSMLSDGPFPSMFSMMDTAETRAQVIVTFLKEMGYVYMDIWYHKFSETVANTIYNDYVLERGCGRIEEVTDKYRVPEKISGMYAKTTGEASEVQLIIHNSLVTTKVILKYMLQDLGFKNKIYILGVSNGRRSYVADLKEILDEFGSGNDTIVFPQPDILNTKSESFAELVSKNWTTNKDAIDEMYVDAQERKCPVEMTTVTVGNVTTETWDKSCKTTSWMGYVIGGTKVLLQALYDNLQAKERGNCAMDFRDTIYNTIVNVNRSMEVKIDRNFTINATFPGKTLKNAGFLIGVYQSKTGEYHDLGTSYLEEFKVSDPALLKTIVYEQTCAPVCQPGFYRLYDERYAYLPCCWTCTQCPSNHFSTDENVNECQLCNVNETNTANSTGCEISKFIYIEPNSKIFILGTFVILLCLILVIGVGVFIFYHEEKPLIKASEPGYLYAIVFSLAVGVCSSFIPFLKPTISTCTAEYLSLSAFAVLVTANLLWKCTRVYVIFAADDSGFGQKIALGEKLKTVDQTWLNVGSLVAVLFLGAGDYFTMKGPGWTFIVSQIQVHKPKYMTCGVESVQKGLFMSPALILPLAYFILTLLLSFKMKKFPFNFKETLFIFAGLAIVLMCWVMFLGGYTLANPYFKAPMRAIVYLVTCIIFLVSIFLPKIIVLITRDAEQQREAIGDYLPEDKPGPSGISASPDDEEKLGVVV